MNVDRIYSRNMVRTARSSSLKQAAALMRDHHVGALVVTEDGSGGEREMLGIVTDRDIVLHAVAEGIAPAEAAVGDIMTRAFATVPKTADLHEALEAMRGSGVRRLGVTEADGSLAGIVSLDDVIDALAVELEGLSGVIRSEREREIARESDRGASSG